jgi:hypothetical protein
MIRFDQLNAAAKIGQIDNLDFRTELLDLAHLLSRLTPDYRDPERFLIQRSALVRELRKLAERVAARQG